MPNGQSQIFLDNYFGFIWYAIILCLCIISIFAMPSQPLQMVSANIVSTSSVLCLLIRKKLTQSSQIDVRNTKFNHGTIRETKLKKKNLTGTINSTYSTKCLPEHLVYKIIQKIGSEIMYGMSTKTHFITCLKDLRLKFDRLWLSKPSR